MRAEKVGRVQIARRKNGKGGRAIQKEGEREGEREERGGERKEREGGRGKREGEGEWEQWTLIGTTISNREGRQDSMS